MFTFDGDDDLNKPISDDPDADSAGELPDEAISDEAADDLAGDETTDDNA